jgi:hypothetical protein
MTDRTLFVAKVEAQGLGAELRILVDNGLDLPFTLEGDSDYRGTAYFMELPRNYQTARGAKLAAARIYGAPLKWVESASSGDNDSSN